jgi:hypothetical protein
MHWRGWPWLARSQSGGLWRTGPGGCTAHRGRLLAEQMSPRESAPWKPRSDRLEGVPLEGASQKLASRVVHELFFLERPGGRRRW